MGIFNKTIKYSKPSKDLDDKIKNLDEELTQTGVIREQDDTEVLYIQESSAEKLPKIYDKVEVPKGQETLYNWRESLLFEETNDEPVVIDDSYHKTIDRVESYISESNKELIEIRDQIFQEISESTLLNLPEIKHKIEKVLEIYDQIHEGLLNEPPSIKNYDPLTPLDQNFVTFDQLSQHYSLFINRIQQQLATLGGGGEYRFQYLDDIVGIQTNSAAYNGKYLQWNSATNKAEFVTVSGGGGGSQTLNQTLGFGNTSSLGMSVGVVTATSINFASGGVLGDLYSDGGIGIGLKASPANYYAVVASNNLQQFLQVDDTQIFITTGYASTTGYYDWKFDKNGVLSGPNNILTIPNAITTPPGNYFIASSDTSTEMSWTGPQGNNIPVFAGISNDNTGTIIANAVTDELGNYVYKTWGFSTDGSTQFPNSLILAPVSQSITLQSDQYTQLMWLNADQSVVANKNVNTDFYVESGGATLDIAYRDGAGYQQIKSWSWYANNYTGEAGFRFPDNTTQYTAFAGYAPTAGIATYASSSIGDFTVGQNLYVTGNLSIGGTSVILNTTQLQVKDKDIVVGYTTDANNNDVSNDTTANHGGISIASTVGSPIINIPLQVGVNSNPSTYKQLMWIKAGNYSGLGTDVWLSNYAISIGNTATVQNGSRLTVGTGFTVYDTYLSSQDIRAKNITAGIVTASSFSGNATSATYATTSGVSTIAGYASTSGISTTSQGLTGTPNISVGVITATDYRIQSVSEKTTIVNGNTVSLIYNTGGGNIGVCTNPSGDIALNVTGIPTDNTFDNYSLAFSVIVTNTGTARSCTAVNLNGVSKTIKWFGGSLVSAISGVTTSNGYDVYSFTGINTVGSASTTANYIVLGSVNGSYR